MTEKISSNSLNRGVLLAILAHPDDESYGPGATLAKYARLGASVYYLCGTRGECGSAANEYMHGFNSVGDMRWNELACAAKELGLAGFYHLGFRDSGMPGTADNDHTQALSRQPVQEVAANITHFIRMLRPQVIITHDPIGGYRHPDHVMIHNATVMAFGAASDASMFSDPEGLPPYQPQKLYYPIFSRRILQLGVLVLPLIGKDPRRFGQNKDIDLTSFANVDFPTHAVIDVRGEPSQMKDRAIACHRSQHSGASRDGLVGLFFNLLPQRNSFMRSYPPVRGTVREADLFEGVTGL